MIKTFLHSGGAGDVIYSLPVLKVLGRQSENILYIKPQNNYNNVSNNYEILKRLLEDQPFIKEVREYPVEYDFFTYDDSIYIDYDLDIFRKQPYIAKNHLILHYFNAFHINPGEWRKPWLYLPEPNKPLFNDFVVINRTLRYQNPAVDWKAIVRSIKQSKVFVGLREEFEAFKKIVPDEQLMYLPTRDLRVVARLIAESDALYCNQSVCLTIAQGLGKKYYLEVAPGHTNCIMNTVYEDLL